MKRASLILCWPLIIRPVAAQFQPGQVDPKGVPTTQSHYQAEYTFDVATDSGAWSKEPKGLQVAFGSTDERYFRCERPRLENEPRLWNASGWRGERLSVQILVWSVDAQEQVRFEMSDLRNDQGQAIDRSSIRLSLVRYVLSNFPYEAKGFSCDITNRLVYLIPDRLETFERFDLPARTVRPVWLSLDIPVRVEPGEYSGTIEVRSSQGRAVLQVKLHVDGMLLPGPRDWKFRLDLWQNPWVLASSFQVAPWSDEHKVLLREHLKLYAQAGGKFITTYTTSSPWSDNSYALEGTMIEWIKTGAGSWRFDYSIFDQYVELAMGVGIDGAITIYTPVPWGYRFRYLDEQSGEYVHVEWPPKAEAFRRFWPVFLDDLKRHLLQKGWFEKTYLGINENPLDVTLVAVKVIKDHSPDWKITR